VLAATGWRHIADSKRGLKEPDFGSKGTNGLQGSGCGSLSHPCLPTLPSAAHLLCTSPLPNASAPSNTPLARLPTRPSRYVEAEWGRFSSTVPALQGPPSNGALSIPRGRGVTARLLDKECRARPDARENSSFLPEGGKLIRGHRHGQGAAVGVRWDEAATANDVAADRLDAKTGEAGFAVEVRRR